MKNKNSPEGRDDKKIAVLIDADNVSARYIGHILDEVSNQGTPTYKRIYGDWTSYRQASWREVLLKHSITPIQQYSYTIGKNSTDSALIIDAMDILYSDSVDGFCIVSSDSDFTRLATRLRESGMMVIGMGEKKTPAAFVAACEKFKYLEVLASVGKEMAEAHEPLAVLGAARAEAPDPPAQAAQGQAESHEVKKQQQPHQAKKQPNQQNQQNQPSQHKDKDRAMLIKTIRTIVSEISDEDGWAFLGELGNVLNRRLPDFDARNYGAMKLTPLIVSLNSFEVESRKTSNPYVTHKYIRNITS
ncbi:MAG: NYN domain-containing protein [Clostridiales Family XIII bacterium]|jgi:hypothetical protein|nr:NYN domain-containing protein [Clostridiales Family XIII bacterium]